MTEQEALSLKKGDTVTTIHGCKLTVSYMCEADDCRFYEVTDFPSLGPANWCGTIYTFEGTYYHYTELEVEPPPDQDLLSSLYFSLLK